MEARMQVRASQADTRAGESNRMAPALRSIAGASSRRSAASVQSESRSGAGPRAAPGRCRLSLSWDCIGKTLELEVDEGRDARGAEAEDEDERERRERAEDGRGEPAQAVPEGARAGGVASFMRAFEDAVLT